MEAEKKADEIMKLHAVTYLCDWSIEYELDLDATKNHALIHVNGIIREINKYSHTDLADIQEWQEVKTIIENK